MRHDITDIDIVIVYMSNVHRVKYSTLTDILPSLTGSNNKNDVTLQGFINRNMDVSVKYS